MNAIGNDSGDGGVEIQERLVIREDKRRGVFVDGLSEWIVQSPKEVGPGDKKGSIFIK
jgi:hypothetical protein